MPHTFFGFSLMYCYYTLDKAKKKNSYGGPAIGYRGLHRRDFLPYHIENTKQTPELLTTTKQRGGVVSYAFSCFGAAPFLLYFRK